MAKAFFFTDDQIEAILTWPGKSLREVAEHCGVSAYMVGLYRDGKSPRGCEAMAALRARGIEPLPKPDVCSNRRFTDEQIMEMQTTKESSRKLAKKYGCAASTIRMFRSGRTYGGVQL